MQEWESTQNVFKCAAAHERCSTALVVATRAAVDRCGPGHVHAPQRTAPEEGQPMLETFVLVPSLDVPVPQTVGQLVEVPGITQYPSSRNTGSATMQEWETTQNGCKCTVHNGWWEFFSLRSDLGPRRLCEKHVSVKSTVAGCDVTTVQQHYTGSTSMLLVCCWFGLVWFGLVWFGLVWFGLVWFGLVWFGLVWFGLVWFGLVWFGLVWFGLVWFGLVWFGLVWFGLVWFVQCITRGDRELLEEQTHLQDDFSQKHTRWRFDGSRCPGKGKAKENPARARRVARKEKKATQVKVTEKRQWSTRDSRVSVETAKSTDTKLLIAGTSSRPKNKGKARAQGSRNPKRHKSVKVTQVEENLDTKNVCTAMKFCLKWTRLDAQMRDSGYSRWKTAWNVRTRWIGKVPTVLCAFWNLNILWSSRPSWNMFRKRPLQHVLIFKAVTTIQKLVLSRIWTVLPNASDSVKLGSMSHSRRIPVWLSRTLVFWIWFSDMKQFLWWTFLMITPRVLSLSLSVSQDVSQVVWQNQAAHESNKNYECDDYTFEFENDCIFVFAKWCKWEDHHWARQRAWRELKWRFAWRRLNQMRQKTESSYYIGWSWKKIIDLARHDEPRTPWKSDERKENNRR